MYCGDGKFAVTIGKDGVNRLIWSKLAVKSQKITFENTQ